MHRLLFVTLACIEANWCISGLQDLFVFGLGIEVKSLKLHRIITCIELYIVEPVMVTLVKFRGHSSS